MRHKAVFLYMLTKSLVSVIKGNVCKMLVPQQGHINQFCQRNTPSYSHHNHVTFKIQQPCNRIPQNFMHKTLTRFRNWRRVVDVSMSIQENAKKNKTHNGIYVPGYEHKSCKWHFPINVLSNWIILRRYSFRHFLRHRIKTQRK